MDGALRQLVELMVTGYVSMVAYLVFKACEYKLVHDVLSVPHLVDPTDVESDAVTTPGPASESPEAKR